MMKSSRFATLPHPFKDNGNKAPDRQREGTTLLGVGWSSLHCHGTDSVPEGPSSSRRGDQERRDGMNTMERKTTALVSEVRVGLAIRKGARE